MFHEFYVRIEEIHNTTHKTENIFVDTIDDHFKPTTIAKEEEQNDAIKREYDNTNPTDFLFEQFDDQNDDDDNDDDDNDNRFSDNGKHCIFIFITVFLVKYFKCL